MREIDAGMIGSIYLIKQLYDNKMAGGLLQSYGHCELNGDYYYEMAYTAIGGIFKNTVMQFNEEKEMETWVFMDPLIDEFCRLCRKYELSRSMSEDENPFLKSLEQSIRSGFSFNNYDYDFDWKLCSSDRGRKRLLLFTGPEFCCHSDVPCGLLEIREGLEYYNKRLREELDDSKCKVIELPSKVEDGKEAA